MVTEIPPTAPQLGLERIETESGNQSPRGGTLVGEG